jgi:hypothetical protein
LENALLLFEGDQQRWRLPLGDLEATVESFRESTHENAITDRFLILRCEIDGQLWETPLRAVWRRWNKSENAAFVDQVQSSIAEHRRLAMEAGRVG